MEIERKFLVDLKNLPVSLDELKGEPITQAYVSVASDKKEVRIRKKAERYYLTVKCGRGLSREETEIDLTEDQFLVLLPTAGDLIVEKIRYIVPLGEHTGELDVFQGRHEGLALIEVEFSSEQEAHAFRVPTWFGAEKTDDGDFKNAALALC